MDTPEMEAILRLQAYPKHFEKHAAQCFEEEKQNQKITPEVPKGKAQLNLAQQLLSVQPGVIYPFQGPCALGHQ